MTRRQLLRVAFCWVCIFSAIGIMIFGGAQHLQAQTNWTQDVFNNVPQAAGMQIDYALQIPNSAAYNATAPVYGVNNSASIASGSFSQIGYFLELQTSGGSLQYIYVSFDAAPFCTNAADLGIPTATSGTVFHYGTGSVNGGGQIQDMNVYSNVAGITTGTNISTGNAQFWGTDYATGNSYNVPNASGTTFDWGVHPIPGGYGALQLANYGASQCLISINNWGGNGGTIDIGIGNDPTGGNPDWTFAGNAANYTVKNLFVLVGNPNVWTGASSAAWSSTANWSSGTLPTAGLPITLGAVAGGPSAATIDLGSSNQTVSALTFQNVVPSVTVSSTGNYSLILSNGTAAAPISVSGNHFINSLVTLNSQAAITVVTGSDASSASTISSAARAA